MDNNNKKRFGVTSKKIRTGNKRGDGGAVTRTTSSSAANAIFGRHEQIDTVKERIVARRISKKFADSPPEVVYVNGVGVKFPFKPYQQAQIPMLVKITEALNGSKNALLESPTGTGKSMSLLCASLAWQEKEFKRLLKLNLSANNDDKKSVDAAINSMIQVKKEDTPPGPAPAPVATTPKPADTMIISADMPTVPCVPEISDDDTDIIVEPKKPRVNHDLENILARKGIKLDPKDSELIALADKLDNPSRVSSAVSEAIELLPKIYFSSRTHGQVAQVVHELSRTGYAPKYTILGSRSQYCINQMSKDRDPLHGTECKQLVEDKQCPYFKQQGKDSLADNERLAPQGDLYGWDLEDLTVIGQCQSSCPYYASRTLADDAWLIFCPYNYLIDAGIRSAMNLPLRESIIIVDEAHNIEDVSRDSASVEAQVVDLVILDKQILEFLEKDPNFKEKQSMEKIDVLIKGILSWTGQFVGSKEIPVINGKKHKYWTGKTEVIKICKQLGLDIDTYSELSRCYNAISREFDDRAEEARKNGEKTPGIASIGNLSGYFCVWDIMLKSGYWGSAKSDDYVVSITAERADGFGGDDVVADARAVDVRGANDEYKVWLSFTCLNPAIAFSGLKGTRNILLASGTLAPINSFSSELGAEFKVTLEANHVIDPAKQVFVNVVDKSLTGQPLIGTYKFASTVQYQDAIGDVVLQCVQHIPHGVLCFFPSYSMLDNMFKRWHETGLYDSLVHHKYVYREPRRSKEFDGILRDYKSLIEKSKTGNGKGVLLCAVCRGKVSEGMDFKDEEARAVIIIGVPYPNLKDTQVECKRKYNDRLAGSSNLISGEEWYTLQAYRAVNQAIGRCIRHKDDYGAILFLDQRYGDNSIIAKLSKWMRGYVTMSSAPDAVKSLDAFFTRAAVEYAPKPKVIDLIVDDDDDDGIHVMPKSKVIHLNYDVISHVFTACDLQNIVTWQAMDRSEHLLMSVRLECLTKCRCSQPLTIKTCVSANIIITHEIPLSAPKILTLSDFISTIHLDSGVWVKEGASDHNNLMRISKDACSVTMSLRRVERPIGETAQSVSVQVDKVAFSFDISELPTPSGDVVIKQIALDNKSLGTVFCRPVVCGCGVVLGWRVAGGDSVESLKYMDDVLLDPKTVIFDLNC